MGFKKTSSIRICFRLSEPGFTGFNDLQDCCRMVGSSKSRILADLSSFRGFLCYLGGRKVSCNVGFQLRFNPTYVLIAKVASWNSLLQED